MERGLQFQTILDIQALAIIFCIFLHGFFSPIILDVTDILCQE